MVATLLIAAALLGQVTVVAQAPAGPNSVDVAYEEMSKRDAASAIERIQANRLTAEHPAALINLGSAYAMLGQKGKAAKYYRSAIASEESFDLQLADGSWMDSRRIAWKAIKALDGGKVLALR